MPSSPSYLGLWSSHLDSTRAIFHALLQDVTMRLIAERLLPAGHATTYRTGSITAASIRIPRPREGCQYHLYCSEHNVGARELMSELQLLCGPRLRVPSEEIDDARALQASEQVLLFLDTATWQGRAATLALEALVLQAASHHVRVLVVYDDSVSFAELMDATPASLRAVGIFDRIAIPLKMGPWRAASLAMMANACVEPVEQAGEPLKELTETYTHTSWPAVLWAALGTGSLLRRLRTRQAGILAPDKQASRPNDESSRHLALLHRSCRSGNFDVGGFAPLAMLSERARSWSSREDSPRPHTETELVASQPL